MGCLLLISYGDVHIVYYLVYGVLRLEPAFMEMALIANYGLMFEYFTDIYNLIRFSLPFILTICYTAYEVSVRYEGTRIYTQLIRYRDSRRFIRSILTRVFLISGGIGLTYSLLQLMWISLSSGSFGVSPQFTALFLPNVRADLGGILVFSILLKMLFCIFFSTLFVLLWSLMQRIETALALSILTCQILIAFSRFVLYNPMMVARTDVVIDGALPLAVSFGVGILSILILVILSVLLSRRYIRRKL